MSKVSYLITCSTETDTLTRLLKTVQAYIGNDEIIILMDKKHVDEQNETHAIVGAFHHWAGGRLLSNPLDNNYGAHKNFGIENCTGDFIFQIDGDELPTEALLGENLHAILDSNPTLEAYAVPRINDFRGVTPNHAAQWCWRLTESPTYKRPVVNWPDYQFRIFKRDYPRISFLRRLHEKIEGYDSYVCLPADENYALYHDKTIETQIKTNLRYNQAFTQDENKGHGVFSK
jgi:glycosyltransferase involved in cell wall biosynthesis